MATKKEEMFDFLMEKHKVQFYHMFKCFMKYGDYKKAIELLCLIHNIDPDIDINLDIHKYASYTLSITSIKCEINRNDYIRFNFLYKNNMIFETSFFINFELYNLDKFPIDIYNILKENEGYIVMCFLYNLRLFNKDKLFDKMHKMVKEKT